MKKALIFILLLILIFLVGCSSKNMMSRGTDVVAKKYNDSLPLYDKPNIILIMADDLGYGDTGCYGSDFVLTPNLDKLRQESMKFTNFYVHPICHPTRASILSGQFPSRFGLRRNCDIDSYRGLPEGVTTVTEVLKGVGYSTYHVGKWHLGHKLPVFLPTRRGYDEFFGFLLSDFNPNGYFNPYLQRNNESSTLHNGHMTDILGKEVMNILDRNHSKPFFITYWPYAPHGKLYPPERWLSKYPNQDTNLSKYAALISTLDENIGMILSKIREKNFVNDTIVIFLSDNGVQFGKKQGFNNAGLKGRKATVYDGGIKSPLLIRWPGRVPPNSLSDELTSSQDIFPTLAKIAGVEISDLHLDGRSIVSIFDGGEVTSHILFWELLLVGNNSKVKRQGALREENWKYIYDNGVHKLYNMVHDPMESSNTAKKNPMILGNLRKKFKEIRWETAEIPLGIFDLKGNVTEEEKLLFFKGDGGVARIPHKTLLNPDDYELSFSVWIYPTSYYGDYKQRIVGKGYAWNLVLNDQKLELELNGNNDSTKLIVNDSIPLNQWTHISFTLRPNAVLYINGKKIIERPYSRIIYNDNDVTLGNSDALTQPFLGFIYNPKFFTASLLESEVEELYTQYKLVLGLENLEYYLFTVKNNPEFDVN